MALKSLRDGAHQTHRQHLLLAKALQPALRSCQSGGLYPVMRSHFGDRFRKIVPHRPFAKPQPARHLGRAFALACPAQNLTFAITQRVCFCSPCFCSQVRINNPLPTRDPPYGVRKLCRRTVFQQISMRSRLQRTSQISRPRKRRQHKHSRLRIKLSHLYRKL